MILLSPPAPSEFRRSCETPRIRSSLSRQSGTNFPPPISPGPPGLFIKDVYFISAEGIRKLLGEGRICFSGPIKMLCGNLNTSVRQTKSYQES